MTDAANQTYTFERETGVVVPDAGLNVVAPDGSFVVPRYAAHVLQNVNGIDPPPPVLVMAVGNVNVKLVTSASV